MTTDNEGLVERVEAACQRAEGEVADLAAPDMTVAVPINDLRDVLTLAVRALATRPNPEPVATADEDGEWLSD